MREFSFCLTQLDLHLAMHRWLIQLLSVHSPDNRLTVPPNILPHSCTKSPPPPVHHNAVTSPPSVCYWLVDHDSTAAGPFHWIMQGNPGETPPPLCVFVQTRVSSFLRLACLLHQTETCLNRHFRWVWAISDFADSLLERQLGPEKFETVVWLISTALGAHLVCSWF